MPYSEENQKKFFDAIAARETEQAIDMVKKRDELGLDFNRIGPEGWLPFQTACGEGLADLVKYIAEHANEIGIDLNKSDDNGITPFYMACRNGHMEIVQYLAENFNIDTNKSYKDGMSPFYKACENGHIDVVKYLMANAKKLNIELNKQDNVGWTPFYIACHQGKKEIVKYLIDNAENFSIDLSTPDKVGKTPFYIACAFGHMDIVKELVEKNSRLEINRAHKYGMTPLGVAFDNGRASVVKYLIEKKLSDSNMKLDLDVINGANKNSFYQACKNLLTSSTDREFYASASDRLELAKILVDNAKTLNIDLNKVNENGKTTFYYLVKRVDRKAVELVKYLLEQKIAGNIDLDIHTDSFYQACENLFTSRTDSEFASASDRLELAKILVDNAKTLNIDLNKVNENGKTTFYYLVERGDQRAVELIKYLLEQKIAGKIELDIHTAPEGALPLLQFFQPGNNLGTILNLARKAGCEEIKPQERDVLQNYLNDRQNTHDTATNNAIKETILSLRKTLVVPYADQDGKVSEDKSAARDQFTAEPFNRFMQIFTQVYNNRQNNNRNSQAQQNAFNRLSNNERESQSYIMGHSNSTAKEYIGLICLRIEQFYQDPEARATALSDMAENLLITLGLSHDVCTHGFFNAGISSVQGVPAFEGIAKSATDILLAEQQLAINQKVIANSSMQKFVRDEMLPSILFGNSNSEIKNNLFNEACVKRNIIPERGIDAELQEKIVNERSYLDMLRGQTKEWLRNNWNDFKVRFAPHITRIEPIEADYRTVDQVVSHQLGVQFDRNMFIKVYQDLQGINDHIIRSKLIDRFGKMLDGIGKVQGSEEEIEQSREKLIKDFIDAIPKEVKSSDQYIGGTIRECVVLYTTGNKDDHDFAKRFVENGVEKFVNSLGSYKNQIRDGVMKVLMDTLIGLGKDKNQGILTDEKWNEIVGKIPANQFPLGDTMLKLKEVAQELFAGRDNGVIKNIRIAQANDYQSKQMGGGRV